MPVTRNQRRKENIQIVDEPYMFNGTYGRTFGILNAETARGIEKEIEHQVMCDIKQVAPYISFKLPEPTDMKSYAIIELYYKFWRRFKSTKRFINSKRHLFGKGVYIDSELIGEHRLIRKAFYKMLKACDWFDIEHRNHLKIDRERYEKGVYLNDGTRLEYGCYVTPKLFCLDCNTIDLTGESTEPDDDANIEVPALTEIPANQMEDPICFAYFFELPITF